MSTVEKLKDLFFQNKRDELSEELNKMLRCLKSNVEITDKKYQKKKYQELVQYQKDALKNN